MPIHPRSYKGPMPNWRNALTRPEGNSLAVSDPRMAGQRVVHSGVGIATI
jgi:hypothetical protein